MNKELFFLTDYADLGRLDPVLLKKSDALAMTPGAMLAFDERRLPYLTLNDLYHYEEFRRDNAALMRSMEDLCFGLDRKYEPFLNYPRAFSGNIYWFLVFFADLYYVAKICGKISRSYGKVHFLEAGGVEEIDPFQIKFRFSPVGIVVESLAKGLDNNIRLFQRLLPSGGLRLDSPEEDKKRPGVSAYRFKMSFGIKNAVRKVRPLLPQFGQEGVIFIVQDSYEVSLLKRYMPGFKFMNPMRASMKISEIGDAERQDMPVLFREDVESFAGRCFRDMDLMGPIAGYFNSYFENIICRLNLFAENARKMFARHRPAALFYSRDTSVVYEDILAHIANENRVPVFAFQHGGTTMLFLNPYQRYLEQSSNVGKTNILQSKVEKEYYAGNVSVAAETFGSIKLHRLHRGLAVPANRKKAAKVLYCAHSFGSFQFKDLLMYMSDDELYESQRNVVDAASRFGLDMDIKITSPKYHYRYFKMLARGRSNIRILTGFPAEEIMNEYGLVLLNDITSALIPTLIVMDMPVIVYMKDVSFLRVETRHDFEKRFYLALSRNDLDRYMELYKAGELESKFSLDMVDRYAFPVDKGDPGVNISRYIRGKVSVRCEN